MIRRLLIANRGEIARRIARTCRRMDIDYVAVHSEVDVGAPHLKGAAATFCLGPAASAESYLRIDRLIAAARETGCDAVHPGYGFLSENAAFARAVIDAGLVFVGPEPETIAAMSDKSTAKTIMSKAGVQIVPGANEAYDDIERVAAMARKIGLPVLLKPAAGGGGKGMTVVNELDGLEVAVESGIRVARSCFDDGRLLVERLVIRPRHVEVQVFGDDHGNIVHMFERECSLQRRHQKIVEEAPAPNLTEDVRQRVLEAAVRGARALCYRNAGTFEFLLGADGLFYFLEVNTRLQVEHPVTEEITGLDLVEWQLRVAAGEPLPLSQGQIHARGHAIECRIYAENAAANFRPAPGRALKIVWPEDLRIESAIEDGSDVPSYYDPLVAKLVARGGDRAEALAAARRGLAQTRILGLTSNIDFLMRLLGDAQVVEGRVDTRYVDDNLARFIVGNAEPAAVACAGALALLARRAEADPASPWLGGEVGVLDRIRLDPAAPLGRMSMTSDGHRSTARLLARGPQSAVVAVGDGADSHVYQVSGTLGDSAVWNGRVDDSDWSALISRDVIELVVDGRRVRVETASDGANADAGDDRVAVAPMPGAVVAVRVKAGDRVVKGQVLLIVEAMKMENPVLAPADAVVTEVKVELGTAVIANQVLVLLTFPEEQA
jgi:acetyl-CoA/propionyl-CoA/long-chain acyl-CoA carboxylase, biotin carboxylase, biotin carboxyl carrier protein